MVSHRIFNICVSNIFHDHTPKFHTTFTFDQINWRYPITVWANVKRNLTVASISVTRVTKGSKLRISTTRWSRRSKIALKTPPEISRRIFWCNKNFWKRNFQHPIKPEVDRKWRNAVVQLVINTMENLHMYLFEYCESDCNCFYVLVTRVTNMDATVKL